MEPRESAAVEPASPGKAPDDAFERAVAALTQVQRRCVDADNSALCIVAGAGSGKTRVLTLRAARRIRDGTADADHTAIWTFTRKAANELRQRLRLYGVAVSGPSAPGGTPGPGVRAGTLHQLALALLRRHALDVGGPPPVVIERRYRTVTAIVGDPILASAIDTEIGWSKANCLGPGAYAEAVQSSGRPVSVPLDRVVEAFEAYQLSLTRRRVLDLDDVLIGAGDLLERDIDFAERVRWRYRHLSVDEFQDVNPTQFRLIQALRGDRSDLCAVGDPDQAIFGWNGADPGLIYRLPELVPGMEVARLGENHRSTPQVVAAASAALGTTSARSARSVSTDGPLPEVTEYEDEIAEARGVIAVLLDRSADGLRWSDQAVLARTNDQLTVVRQALADAGIPHRLAPDPDTPIDRRRYDPDLTTEDAVELATFHRAKGLEWTAVNVVGLEEGFVPIVYAQSVKAQAEERRLLYVAITRASIHLHCSWARNRTLATGRQVERQPSPWLSAVAGVARTGTVRNPPRDTGRWIAEIRATLNN